MTVNAASGVITTVALTTAGGSTSGPFTVNNSYVTSSSTILLTAEYANGKTGFPVALVENIATGSFGIRLLNVHTGAALNDVVKINFSII